jgi:hypothetical protein
MFRVFEFCGISANSKHAKQSLLERRVRTSGTEMLFKSAGQKTMSDKQCGG